ncbi:MAG TPA: protein kinase [Polyangiaceae bacterium]|jgi:serine/threonine-protein kinase
MSGAAARGLGSESSRPEARYQFGREIGRGGMGVVHEATHRALGKRVAIKTFHPHLAARPDCRARFVGEGRAIAQVRHPHVVEVFDLGEEDGAPYLVMELLEGSTLTERLAHGRVLSLAETVDLALPLTSALSAAHAAGVVHRDVKPSNVFLRNGALGEPCILDFGVSKHASPALVEELTQSGTIVGSYPYFSPEHTRGAKAVTALSDQYSLAVVLYECVTGARPFEGGSAYELMHAIATRDVQAPSRVRSSIPPAFDAVLLRAMHREPLNRYPSMRAFGSALLGFASRRAWHVWAAEFGAAGAESGLESTALESAPPLPLPAAPAPPAPARSARRGLPLLAAAALLCGALSSGGDPHPAAATPLDAPPVPTPLVASLPRAPEALPAPVASPSSSEQTPPLPALVPAPKPTAQAHSPTPRLAHTTGSPSPLPSTRPAERGSNGVAIFD